MGSLDDRNVPVARVVRSAGADVVPPRDPLALQARRLLAPAAEHGRTALAAAIGMWPLTAVVFAAAALLWAAGFGGATP